MIGFLHTAEQHVGTFEGLLEQALSRQQVAHQQVVGRHLVREDLLEHMRVYGDTPALRQQVYDALQTLAQEARVIVCTCSSLAAIAENLDVAVPVLRIDRALAEAAVRHAAVGQGKRILVLATLASTLEPTTTLFADVNQQNVNQQNVNQQNVNQQHAHKTGKQVSIDVVLCAGAWEVFARADHEAYAKHITATALEQCQHHVYDLIALAQASMTVALDRPDFPDLPTLTSPLLGVEAALHYLHQQNLLQATPLTPKASPC